jgi:hypothetical protein
VARSGIAQVAKYMKMLEQREPPGRSTNGAFDHVHLRWTDKPDPRPTISAKDIWAAAEVERKPVVQAGRDGIRIVLIGTEGSGRTRLKNSIITLMSEESPLELEGIRQRDLKHAEARSGEPSKELEYVILHKGNKRYQVSVIDTSGIEDVERINQEIHRADLIVAAVPPEMIAGERTDLMESLASLLIRGMGTDPHGLVAIAYTKADEYGILDERGLRVLWSSRPLTAYYDRKRDWDTFVRKLRRGGLIVPPLHLKNVDVSVYGRDEWTATRATVVDRSRVLWEALMSPGGSDRILNGYFVSSEPLDDFYMPPYRRGHGQMLADFFALLDKG